MAKSRKLPMVKRETQKERSVSFTKRRQGLFNKAAELSMLCDAQIAVLVSSPSQKQPKKKMYSFGHPSVASVLDAFLQKQVPSPLDDQAKQSAVSLWKEIDSLESKPEGLDDFEGSESIEELKKLVGALENMVSDAKRRLDHDENKYGHGTNLIVQSPSSPTELKDGKVIRRSDNEINNQNMENDYNVGEESNNDLLLYGNYPQDWFWSSPFHF